MSSKKKHPNEVPREILLAILLLTPIVWLVTFMVMTHHAYDTPTSAKWSVVALAAWWMLGYVWIRIHRWRKVNGPTSLPPV
jgi:high-affinity K+ transport system ATPase subunit B